MESHFVKSMSSGYILGLGTLAVLAAGAYWMLHQETQSKQAYAMLLNMSGRQRMLSQRLALYSLRLANSHEAGEQEELRKELLNEVQAMETSIHGLIHLTSRLPGKFSPQMHDIFYERPLYLDRRLRAYLDEVKAFVNEPDDQLCLDNLHLQKILASAASDLPLALEKSVEQFQLESESGLAKLQRLEKAHMLLTLAVILLMGLLIFRPMVKRIQIHMAERKNTEVQMSNLIIELQTALANVKTLRGLLPICAYCKKIRDDQGYWNRIEDYVTKHSEADFTHGFCPDCVQKLEEEV